MLACQPDSESGRRWFDSSSRSMETTEDFNKAWGETILDMFTKMSLYGRAENVVFTPEGKGVRLVMTPYGSQMLESK